MARIRSIKPEFWTKNLKLSDSCALFFIGLWNFCDDEGKHTLDLDQLVAELGGRWHRGKVKLFVSCLLKTGQLRINSDSTWIQVTGWSHQRIDNPKQPTTKASELQWLSTEDSTNAMGCLASNPRKDRIGEDREDRIGSGSAPDLFAESNVVAPTKQKPKKDPSAGALAHEFIATYCECFKGRYGSNPDITGKDTGIAMRLVKDLGLARAKALVDTFLLMQDSFFQLRRHDLTTFESNLKAVAVKHDTGKGVNRIQAYQSERQDANTEAVKAFLASKEGL